MVSRIKALRDVFRIKRSGFFDENYYLIEYPDVRLSDVDPVSHFVFHGWREGRNPSPTFNTKFYLESNPDVAQAKINPLIHYILYGQKEGREATAAQEIHDKQEVNSLITASIIVPVYNALEFTITCLNKLFNTSAGFEFEIIAINNGSETDTREWLDAQAQKYPNLTVIHNEKNQGFSAAVNQGISQASGYFVIVLNNDTIPGEGWLERLVHAAKQNPGFGVLSPVTNYVGEGPQIDLEAFDLSVSEVDSYAIKISQRNEIIVEPRRLVFFCVLIRRELIDLIGGLDAGYIRGNFEDDDYCFRTIVAGYQLGIVSNAFVYHHGSATFKANSMNYVTHYEENRERFYLKAGRYAASFPLGSKERKPFLLDHQPMVSVIVRTVNRPETLRVALNSLVHQTFKDFEVVLVNDGGPNLGPLLVEYEPYLNINYVHHEKSKGRTPALNAGLFAAQGQWISYLDDDDLYYPWHFAVMYQATQRRPAEKFFFGLHNRTLIDADFSLDPIEFKQGPAIPYTREQLLLSNFIPINTWFHKKSITSRGFDESFDTLEDYEFLLHLSENNHFNAVSVPVCEYRFYLSQSNSIARLRSDTYMALQRLYERYKVKAPESIRERKGILLAQLNLIDAIERLTKGLDAKATAEKKHIFRKILDLVGAI